MQKEAKKKKFRWWYIPLGILLLLVILIAALVLWMHSMLPWPNMIAMTSNFQMELSDGIHAAAVGGQRDYSTLPEVLTMQDGTPVTTEREFAARRTEILALFEENVYGVLPKTGYSTSFQIEEEGEALDGKATRRQVRITVTTEKGSSDAMLLLYLPNTDEPSPVVVGLNFNGNHTVLDDPAILPSCANEKDEEALAAERGKSTGRWSIAEAIERGYGVATVWCNDFAPDDAKGYTSRVVGLFDEPEFKAVGAWAFGIHRCVDYLVEAPEVDARRIADIGHSRLGKAAVGAGANDERIALVISNDSGNTGASLTRENHGETLKSINAMFKHWFCTRYQQYGADANALPVDQHLLLACVAPRKLYVASADGDLWADPQGAWNSFMASRPAFELYGLETPPDGCLADGETQPHGGMSVWTEAMGYHSRAGWHNVLPEDWAYYLDYMDKYL